MLGLSKELLESVLGCSFSKWVMSFNTLLFRVGFWDPHYLHHLGACLKCRVSGPTPDQLKQNLHFNKILK